MTVVCGKPRDRAIIVARAANGQLPSKKRSRQLQIKAAFVVPPALVWLPDLLATVSGPVL
jgi:hypothetical protein